MNASFLGMFGATPGAIDVVSLLILGIVMLLVGNTLAMSLRESTHEFGVLQAIGFMPRHLVMFVLGEAAVLGLASGIGGMLLAWPLVRGPVSRFLEEEMEIPPLTDARTWFSALSRHGRGVVRGCGRRDPRGRCGPGAGALCTPLIEFATVNWATGRELAFRFVPSLASLGTGTTVGVLGGLLSAIRAARVDPVAAMRV